MDPATATSLVSEVLKFGLPGVLIVVLTYVAIHRDKLFTDSQKARFEDHEKNSANLTGVIEKSLSSQKDTNTILEVIKDRMGRNDK